MAKHRARSVEFKCEGALECLAGEKLMVWRGPTTSAASDPKRCEAPIASLERLVGKQALELGSGKGR